MSRAERNESIDETSQDAGLDALLAGVAAELRRPETPSADFDARVMARVRAMPRPASGGARLRAAARWLVEPRTVRVPPLAGLAAAAAVAALAVLLPARRHDVAAPPVIPAAAAATPAAPTIAASGGAASRPVQFVVAVPQAVRVSLVGDFNDWNAAATPLRPVAGRAGLWVVEVPLSAGRHEYAFVVDGVRWMPDPAAPAAPADDFGTPNSVITVTDRISS